MKQMLSLRRARSGLASIYFVLVIAAVAVVVVGARTLEIHEADKEQHFRTTGHVFATWFDATHRYSQDNIAELATLVAAGGSLEITSSMLVTAGLVSSGLKPTGVFQHQFIFGIISDGNDVPMAFGIIKDHEDLSRQYHSSIILGAEEFGLSNLGVVFDGELVQSEHVARINAVSGTQLAEGDIFAAADTAISVDSKTVYRHAQPGRPDSAKLRTAIDFDGFDIVASRRVNMRSLEVSDELTVNGAADFATDAQFQSTTANQLATASVGSVNLTAVTSSIQSTLTVGTATAAGVSSNTAEMASANVSSNTTSLNVHVGDQTAATNDVVAREVVTETLNVDGTHDGETVRANSLFAPAADLTGNLSTGTCVGC